MSRFEKWSVWTTSFLTVATGAGYFVTKYLFTSPDPYSVVGHPWEPYFLKAHILVSPLLLFALGTVAVRHVWNHLVTGVRWSRRSALLTTAAVIPMVLTGYLIQVLTDQGWIRAMAVSHIAFGFLYGLGLLAHTWIVRRGPPEPPDASPPAGSARERWRRGRSPPADGAPSGRELPSGREARTGGQETRTPGRGRRAPQTRLGKTRRRPGS